MAPGVGKTAETGRPAGEKPAPKNSLVGLVIRLVLYVFVYLIAFVSMAFLLQPAGALVTAVLATFLAGLTANLVALRAFEGASLKMVGLTWHKSTLWHGLLGWLLGSGAACFAIGLPILIGKARMVPSPDYPFSLPSILFVSLALLLGALGEELLFRGYIYQYAAGKFGAFQTLLPLSVLFAAAHAANLNASPLGLFNTFLWGALLGYCVLRSGDLWLPIGMHFGWNLALALFGVNLSGFTIGTTGYTVEWRANASWSGGSYGPEASLLTTMVVFALVYGLHKLRWDKQQLALLPEDDDPLQTPAD